MGSASMTYTRFMTFIRSPGARERPGGLRLFRGAAAIAVCGLSALCSAPLTAQSLRDTLSGTVTDTAGLAVPGAAVSVKSEATGQSTETRTDAAGHYIVPDLAPGTYDVSVTAVGFTGRAATVAIGAGTRRDS